MPSIVLHEDPVSGNCYKIRLVAAHLGVPITRRRYDILKGETRTAAFRGTVDAHGRIPVLQIDDRFLPESNAACCWLADGSHLIPTDRFDRADMLRWLFWEQYSHEPNVATLRFWRRFVGEDALTDVQRTLVPVKEAAGREALERMEAHLSTRDWLVGDTMTLADIALYAYTHVAEEAGFSLAPLPATRAWLGRVAARPGHVPFDA